MDSFDNDAALVWLSALEARGAVVVWRSLMQVVEAASDEHFDLDTACETLAAAELVAAARAERYDRLPDVAAFWCKRNDAVLAELQTIALRATRRILQSSELAELWSADRDAARWRAHIDELFLRLRT